MTQWGNSESPCLVSVLRVPTTSPLRCLFSHQGHERAKNAPHIVSLSLRRYRTPESVVVGDGCDVIIVGRGVYAAADPATAAQEYATAGWSAYNKRMNSPK